MKKYKPTAFLLALSCATSLYTCPSQIDASDYTPVELTRVSVHDPSILKDQENEDYYVIGSHTASAKSDDLIQWQQLNTDYSNVSAAPFYGNLKETFSKPFQWAGYDDGDCTGGYAIWAPDIIWNPFYKWKDGSSGAYMLYCCSSSTWRRSCISYLVSKTIDGTYEYVDTIVYSGFTKTGQPDGNSSINTKWDNDYLNLSSLIDKGSENGGIDEISENWFTDDGEWNNSYAPNAIDPNLFFDAKGENLYMSYGSWSGGLFLLELDKTTGEAIYPGTDSIDEVSGNFVDRYFGIHLAGGNHQSGEGPYIIYDNETGFYYLYETYGGLTAEGGYNMRLFRSKNPSGPYLDAKGKNAADNGETNDLFGIKLIGNYSFYNQIGKRSAGHNSAFIDNNGEHYLIYHQRFDIEPQLEAHEIRVHQQYLNEEQWPVTAVYEYTGEHPSNYSTSDVIGSYEFINHGTVTNGEMLETQLVTLNENGTINGAVNGIWEKKDSGKGYDFVTFILDNGTTYKGFFFLQHKENNEKAPVMTFSAIGNDNSSIWGSMVNLNDSQTALDMAAVSLKQIIPSSISESIDLPSSIMGINIKWHSSNPEILSDEGHLIRPNDDTRIELTADLSIGQISVSQNYKITIRGTATLVYGYDFQEIPKTKTITPSKDSFGIDSASLMGTTSIVFDETRGNVLKITNDPNAKGVNYLKLPEDTFSSIGPSGYSISLWTNIGSETWEHSALFEANADGNYPMTRLSANLFARINANNYSDVTDSLLSSNGTRNIWQHVVYTVDPNGIKVYLNGTLIGQEKKDLSDCFKKNKTGISQAKNVRLGSGDIWDDEDCQNVLFDNIKIFDGILSSTDIKVLYEEELK